MTVSIYLTAIISLATGLIGLLVGNWQAIGRDKRKEFNAIAERITIVLLKAREQLSPYAEWPDKMDIHFFREALPSLRRRRFDAVLRTYKQVHDDVKSTEDEYGSTSYKNTNLVANCIDRLLRLTRQR